MVNKPSEGTLPEQNNGVDLIKQNVQDVICRVFSRRHGITKIEEKNGTEAKQAPNVLLSINGKREMEDLANEFIAFGCKPEDTVIVYSPQDEEGNKIRRIIQSKNILQNRLQCTAIPTNLLNTGVKIKDSKGELVNKDARLKGKLKHTLEVVTLTSDEILESFNNPGGKYSKYKNIILLSHKSNETGIDITSTPQTNTITISRDKDDWSHDLDIVKNNEGKVKYKNHKEEKDILQITSKNIDKILISFKDETELLDRITVCKKEKRAIFEIQNIINVYFKKHPELYEKYLKVGNLDLTLFCLQNLLDNEKYNIVKEKYLASNDILSYEEKKMLLLSFKETNNLLMRSFLIEYHLIKGIKPDSCDFEAVGLLPFYCDINDRYETYRKAINIQKRSLDEMIKNGEEEGILQRHLWEINEKKFIGNNVFTTFDKENLSIEDILNRLAGNQNQSTSQYENVYHNGYILPAHVGSGKSIWLAELVKKLSLDPKFSVVFLEGRDIDENTISQIYSGHSHFVRRYPNYITNTGIMKFFNVEKGFGFVTPDDGKADLLVHFTQLTGGLVAEGDHVGYAVIQGKRGDIATNVQNLSINRIIKDPDISQNPENTNKDYMSNIILCIDAIDEIKESEIKHQVKKILEKSEREYYFYGVVATARMSEYNDQYNVGFTTIGLENIDKIQYINSRVKDENKRKLIFDTLDTSNLLAEIEGNPLLLFFVCQLVDGYCNDYRELGIKSLEQIENKAELFESIIMLIMYEHEKSKPIHPYKGNLSEIKDYLKSNLKFLSKWGFFLSRKEYKNGEPVDFETFIEDSGKTKVDLNHFNILFKKSEKGEYLFIHKSFQDFFASQYLYFQHDTYLKKNKGKTMWESICDQHNIDQEIIDKKNISDMKKDDQKEILITLDTMFLYGTTEQKIKLNEMLKDFSDYYGIVEKLSAPTLYEILQMQQSFTAEQIIKIFNKALKKYEVKENLKIVKYLCKNPIYKESLIGNIGYEELGTCLSNHDYELFELMRDIMGGELDHNKQIGKYGYTLFMYASMNTNQEVFKALYAQNNIAYIFNQKDNNGMTAFMFACAYGNQNIVEYMIEKHGEEINIGDTDLSQKTAFMLAVGRNNLPLVKYLIETYGSKIDPLVLANGKNVFMLAANAGQVGILTYLYETYKNVWTDVMKQKDFSGRDLFMSVCSHYKNVPFLKLLLEKYKYLIHIKDRDNSKKDALMIACLSAEDSPIKNEMISLLLKYYGSRFDVTKKDNEGRTCFMLACMYQNKKTVQLLVDYYKSVIKIKESDNLGYTAFMLACDQGDENLVKFLGEYYRGSVDLTKKTKAGDIAIDIAKENGFTSIVNYLTTYGEKTAAKNKIDAFFELAKTNPAAATEILLNSAKNK